jgi:hypothetical protein
MSTYNFNLVKELLEELIEQICNQVERPASPNITVAPRIELPLDLDSHTVRVHPTNQLANPILLPISAFNSTCSIRWSLFAVG